MTKHLIYWLFCESFAGNMTHANNMQSMSMPSNVWRFLYSTKMWIVIRWRSFHRYDISIKLYTNNYTQTHQLLLACCTNSFAMMIWSFMICSFISRKDGTICSIVDIIHTIYTHHKHTLNYFKKKTRKETHRPIDLQCSLSGTENKICH